MSKSLEEVHLELPSVEELKRAQAALIMEISSSGDDPEVVHEKLRKKKIPLIVPTDEELNYRKENYADFNVHREKIQCTSCAKNLKSFVSLKQSLAVHPTLSVLQCKTCSKFYGDGTFSVDEDGSDQYCRWCGEGGALYLCSNCSCTFCRPCIKRNFARSTLEEVEDDDWKCFICNPKPLWSHRAVCAAVIKFIAEKSQSKKTKGGPSNTKRKRRVSSTSSDSDDKNQKKRTKKRKKADVSSDNDSEWEEPTSRKKESSGSLTKKKQESKAALDTSDSEKESRSRKESSVSQRRKEQERKAALDANGSEKESRSRRASSRKRVQGSKAALDTSDSEKESRLRKVSSSKKVQESKAALDTSDSEKGRRLRKASSSKKVQESKAALVTSDSEKGSRLRKASSNKKVQESKAALDTSDSEKESRLRKASSVSRSKKEQEKKAALDTNDTGKVSRSRKASSVSRIKKGQENKAALDTSDSEKESRLRKASSSKKVQESKAALDSSDSEKGRRSRKKISSTHKIRLEKDEFRRSNKKEGILSPNSSTHEDGDAATPPSRSSHEGKKKSKMNYSEEEDLVIELNEHTSKSLAEIFKDHLQDIVQAGEGLVEFGRHILNEEITVKNLSKPRKRIKLRNKLDNLCTLSCSNVKQANENFIISYHRFIRGLTSKEGINTDLNKQPNENEESASKSDEEMQVNNEDGKDEELKVSSKDNTESSDKSGEKREGKDDNTEVSKSDESMEVNDEDNTENISMSNESQNENDGKEESPKMKNRSQDDDSSGEERETKSERTLKGEKQGKYNKSENKKKKVQEKDAPEVESMETLDEKNESSGTVDSVVDDIRSEMTEKEGSEQDAEPETETAVEVRSTVAAEEGIEAELGGVEDREEEIQDEVEKAGNNKNEKESSGKSQNISNAGGESLKHNSDEGNTDICSDVNMCGDSQDTDAIEKSQDTDTSSDEPLGNVSEVDKELDATSDLVDGNIDKCSKTDKQVNVDCESLDVSTIPEVQTNNSPQNSPCNMSDANSCSDMWSDGECGGNNTHIMSVIGVLDESLGNISEEEFQMSRNEKQSCVNSHVDASLKSKKKIENDDSELAANKSDNKHEETNETVSEECGSDRPTHETKTESPEAESSDQTECLLNKKNKISISADISSVQCLNEEVEKNYEENSDKIPRDDRGKDNEGTDEDLNASQALDDLNIEEPEDKNKNNEGTDDNDDLNASQALDDLNIEEPEDKNKNNEGTDDDDLNASQALDELKVEKPKDKNKEALKALLASSSEDERRQSHRKRKKHEPKENDKEMNGKESTPSGNVKGVKPTRKSSLSSLSYVSSDSESEDRVVGGLGKDSRVGAFNVKDLEEYKRDEKLRVECKIELKKLPQDVSQKHHGALSSSDDESNEKQIKKLLNMKTLKQCPKRNNSSSESESESEIQKNNKTNKKTLKKEKRKSLTLEDFCNLSDDNSHSSEKSNDENRMEKVLQNMLDNLNNKRNKVAEETLLMSSCSDSDGEESDQKNDKKKKTDSPKKEIKREKNDSSVENSEKNSKEKSNSDKESTDEEARKKKNWRRDKLLRMKLSETDTSEEDRKWKAKQEKKKDKIEKDSDSDGLHGPKRKSRKKTVCRGFLDSDSDVIGISSSESDSDDFKMITKKKRRRESDSNSSSKQKVKSSDSSDSERAKKKKVKRRRIRKPISDSDDSDSCKEINESQKSETTPTKGRKNIRRVMKDDYVAEETRRAAKEEEERRKRIAEKQKFYNEVFEVKKHDGTRTITDIILDFDKETKEILVEVDRKLVPKLKPHQEEGIRFMWNSCFESLKQIERTEGSGCILAHCMGLGKTFQVVTLVHTLMNNEKTKVRSVLIVCPLSTVLNWVNEFNKWLEELPHDIDVFDITKYKQVYERVGVLRQWHENGGVMVLSYEMFRNLCNPNAKRLKKRAIEAYQTALIDPGADLVVCDEGHLLKNDTTAISIAMRRIKTQRRIVLTGTPLQNNLQEYHCMVQFVKPSLLGTRKEFLNRFVNPINNGQYENSTAYDVKVMKRRAHVLHRMLEGCVQRFDYSVLTPFLPPKFEFAVSIRLTDLQIKLYKHYLEYFARGRDVGDGLSHNKTATMFKDYHVLQRVWTHPRVLLMNAEKEEEKKLREESDSEGSLRDFIADSEETSASSIKSSSGSESDKESDKNDKDEVINKWKSSSRNGSERKEGDDNASVKSVEIEEVKEKHPGDPRDWWRQFITDDSLLDDIRQSGKLSLLFALLNECEKLGDKVLVFSQSLNSLNLIEYFLAKIDEANQNNKPDEKLGGYLGTWSLGLDYFRMDGSSTGENRSAWCKNFNREDNHRARLFLISTKAGGLGINLFAANRVIIFDASWNPSHDLQSIFRVYRFGQKKPCYIYRFLAQSTMEERIYSRQVSKLSLACRVVDEQQIERHYSMADLQELYIFNPEENKPKSTPAFPKDRLLADLLKGSSTWIESYHEHDSLLENKEDEELNEEERKAAWDEYEKEKKGITDNVIDPAQQYAQLVEELRRKQPELSEEQVHQQATVTYQKLFDYMRINAELARRQQQQQQQQQQQHLRNYQAHLAQQQKLQLLQQHVPQQLQQYVPQQLQQYVPQRLQQYMSQQMQRPQGNQLPPVHLQQPQVNQNNKSLESVAVQQKEAAAQRSSAGPHTSAVGGSSGGGQHRIKVKSFGLISNSNFSANSGSNQQAPNPFSAAFQARASNSGVQSPRITSAAGSSGGQTVIKSTDVVEVE